MKDQLATLIAECARVGKLPIFAQAAELQRLVTLQLDLLGAMADRIEDLGEKIKGLEHGKQNRGDKLPLL